MSDPREERDKISAFTYHETEGRDHEQLTGNKMIWNWWNGKHPFPCVHGAKYLFF